MNFIHGKYIQNYLPFIQHLIHYRSLVRDKAIYLSDLFKYYVEIEEPYLKCPVRTYNFYWGIPDSWTRYSLLSCICLIQYRTD